MHSRSIKFIECNFKTIYMWKNIKTAYLIETFKKFCMDDPFHDFLE